MKIILFISIIFFSIQSIAQNDVWAIWDPEIIKAANTAKDFEYYSDEEKKVVFFMNLARELSGISFSYNSCISQRRAKASIKAILPVIICFVKSVESTSVTDIIA